MYLKGKTRCDVAWWVGRASDGAGEVSAAYSAIELSFGPSQNIPGTNARERARRKEARASEASGLSAFQVRPGGELADRNGYSNPCHSTIASARLAFSLVAAALKLEHIFANRRLHSKLASPLAPRPDWG